MRQLEERAGELHPWLACQRHHRLVASIWLLLHCHPCLGCLPVQLVVTVLQKLGAKPGAKVAALGTPDQVRSMGSVHSMAHSPWRGTMCKHRKGVAMHSVLSALVQAGTV